MPASVPVALGQLGGSAVKVTRSSLRWLCADGQPLRAGDPVALCNVAVRTAPPTVAFAQEEEDLRVVLVAAVAGRLRQNAAVSRGGWHDEMRGYFDWEPDRVIGTFEPDQPVADPRSVVARFGVAGRRVSEVAEDRTGILTGWHDRKRAWRIGAGRPGTVLGLGICELTPVLRGPDNAFLATLLAGGGLGQVVDVPDTPLVPCARTLIEQARRTDAERALIAEDFRALAAQIELDRMGDWIFAGTLLKALLARPMGESYEVLTEGGLEAVTPDAMIVSVNAEGPHRYRHRRHGYSLSLHAFQRLRTGAAFRAWLAREFEVEQHPIGAVRRDVADLIRLVRETAPRRQILVLNSVAATDREDILCYDAYDPPLSLALRNVRAREINAMLHDLAAETGIAIVDADAIAAELGVHRSIPDGTHQSGEMQDVLREEILSILRARNVPGFGGDMPPG